MPRNAFSIVVPRNPDLLLALADKILQKHYQDGAASKLPATLADQLQNKLTTALTEHTRRHELERLKEKRNEERNLLLGLTEPQSSYLEGTILYFVTATRDLLLGQYRSNARALGDWGFTVNSPKGAVQVIISTKPDELVALAKNIQQKHYQDGSASLLNALDWNRFSSLLYEAEMKLEEGRKANRDKETATQARNLDLGIDKGQTSKTPNTVKYLVKSVRDVLLGALRGRERELGNWGFEVKMSTKVATPPLV